jgi:hypothetical protein
LPAPSSGSSHGSGRAAGQPTHAHGQLLGRGRDFAAAEPAAKKARAGGVAMAGGPAYGSGYDAHGTGAGALQHTAQPHLRLRRKDRWHEPVDPDTEQRTADNLLAEGDAYLQDDEGDYEEAHADSQDAAAGVLQPAGHAAAPTHAPKCWTSCPRQGCGGSHAIMQCCVSVPQGPYTARCNRECSRTADGMVSCPIHTQHVSAGGYCFKAVEFLLQMESSSEEEE